MSAGTQNLLYLQVNAVRFNHNYLQSKNIFSSIFRFLSSHNVNDQVSHPYKTTGKIIVLSCEIKCRTAMAEAAFNKKRALFTSTLDLELRKKFVKFYLEHSVLWC